MIPRPARRGPRKQLIRESDGMLHDLTTDRRIPPSELTDFVTSGGYFEARRHDGLECTAQVLAEVLQSSISEQLQPQALGGGGAVEAMLGAAALDPMMRLFGLWGAWGAAPGSQSRRQRAARAERPRVPPRPPRRGARAFEPLAAMDNQETA